jgi:choline dehydrogenase-like flavoprotein
MRTILKESDIVSLRSTHTDLPAADLQLLLMAVLWLDQGLGKPTQHGFTIGAAALKPRSRGAIKLRSKDPLEPPVIQPNYCTDEAGEDIRVLIERIRQRAKSLRPRSLHLSQVLK